MNQSLKNCFLLALFIFSTPHVWGQPEKNNIQLYSDTHYEGPSRGLKRFGRSAFYAAVRFEKFLNDNYAQNLDAGNIKNGKGFELSYSYIIFRPIALEATGFYTTFDVTELSSKVSTVSHAGFEFYVDAFVLPYIGKISNYVAPYVGVGYQTSSLEWGKNVKAGTGGAIFKAGTRVRIPIGVFFQLEYKQTFPKSSNKLFRSLNIGAGYNF